MEKRQQGIRQLELRRLTIKYCFAQAGFWTSCCTIFGFSNVYLTELGFSVEQVGVFTAAGALFGMLLQAHVAGIADAGRMRLHSLIILLGGILTVVFGSLFLFSGNCGQVCITGLFLLSSVLVWILMPLINSISVYYVNRGCFLDFAFPRGIGSGCFALMSMLFGRLISRYGVDIVLLGGALGSAWMTVSIAAMPVLEEKRERAAEEGSRKQPDTNNFIRFVRKYRWFSYMLLGCSFCLLFLNMSNTYVYQIVCSTGGGVDAMGVGMAIAAMVELIPMIFFVYLNRFISNGKLLVISGLFFALKSIVIFIARSVPVFYFAEFLQIGSIALWAPASVRYTDEIMGDEDRFKGQAYMASTDAIGAVLGNLLGGILIGSFGLKTMLLFELVLACAGALLMYRAYRE